MLFPAAPVANSVTSSPTIDSEVDPVALSAMLDYMAEIRSVLQAPQPPTWLTAAPAYPFPSPLALPGQSKAEVGHMMVLDEFWLLMNSTGPKNSSSSSDALGTVMGSWGWSDATSPVSAIDVPASVIDLLVSGPGALVQKFWEHTQDCRLGWTVLHVISDTVTLVDEGERGLLYRLTNASKLHCAVRNLEEMYPGLTFQPL